MKGEFGFITSYRYNQRENIGSKAASDDFTTLFLWQTNPSKIFHKYDSCAISKLIVDDIVHSNFNRNDMFIIFRKCLKKFKN